ncbi:MAG: type II/IV secretion system protein [Desulfobacteraceae bacterium]|nr:MAG: type II/IV secretion system protein [Desulfobacteraceae bacterium]
MKRKRLGEILAEANLITSTQLELALTEARKSGRRLGRILIENGWASEDDICRTLSSQLRIPKIDLAGRKIENKILNLIPPSICLKYMVVPLGVHDRFLRLAMSNPTDYGALDDIAFITGYPVKTSIASEKEIIDYLFRFHSPPPEAQHPAEGSATDLVQIREDNLDQEDIGFDKLEKAAKGGVTRQLTNGIILNAIKQQASDIHIEPQEHDVSVRFRVDGMMREVMNFAKSAHSAAVSRIKIMANLDITIRRKPQDGRGRIGIEDKHFDLRVSTLPTFFGEKIVIRILQSQSAHALADLGMPQKVFEELSALLKRPQGLILVTGPTGSGKTTTLYAALHHIFSPEINVVTIEDPIEYSLPGINQVQVNPATDLTFAKGLRSLLRQDPDVIMLGEIRDRETAAIALQAAQTGHLVLSTLHTNDAASAVTRLVDIGIEPFVISGSLLCVLGQRLVRKIHADCGRPHELPSAVLSQFPSTGPFAFRRGRGCPECQGTGYVGRVGIYELLAVNAEIAEMIAARKPDMEILRAARKYGMRSMTEDGFQKAREGITTIEEVLRTAPPGERSPFGERQESSPEEVESIASAKPSIHEAPSNSPIQQDRVLVIDDDEAILKIVGKMLTSEFYEVVTAADGAEGLKAVLEKTPDLILVDCKMPNMDGISFIEKLKSQSRLKRIPVIMLTAAEAEETEVKALTVGADDWIRKPIVKARLLARMRRLMK